MAYDPHVQIGTSGWMYKHWNGTFYPEKHGGDKESYLGFYARHFRTVELNNSFYGLPQRQTLKMWREIAPEDFLFAVKASRYITHIRRLNTPRASLDKFFRRVAHLKEKLGPVLFQLPPNWHVNLGRLETFLKALPKGRDYTMEFRDPSWHCEDVYGLLEKYGVSFCIFQLARFLSPIRVTSKMVYVRLHGPTKEKYKGSYSHRQLEEWATRIRAWRKEKRSVYVYFDNDQAAYAVRNAAELNVLLGQETGGRSVDVKKKKNLPEYNPDAARWNFDRAA
ncbi:MAG TPA: DUF72 domain-containing protein [Verrucomicrobiae bacterium]|jgi:uncharacterized protein YecE (DUF72 family)|nr:DUF72 domain-containing protein [Verrucomicrobiae bacterium]